MSEEEKETIEYYENNEYSFGFETDLDIEDFKKAIGIEETDEDTFERHQIRFKTLLNLIEKQQKEIEELKYHIHYKTCAWCGDEFKTKIHNAKYCPKCRETKKREIRISNCKKHYENNKEYFKNYYQNLTDEQKERRRANNREANRRLRERKKCK